MNGNASVFLVSKICNLWNNSFNYVINSFLIIDLSVESLKNEYNNGFLSSVYINNFWQCNSCTCVTHISLKSQSACSTCTCFWNCPWCLTMAEKNPTKYHIVKRNTRVTSLWSFSFSLFAVALSYKEQQNLHTAL